MITPLTEGSKRMLTLCLSIEQSTANILCIYTPTMSASPQRRNSMMTLIQQSRHTIEWVSPFTQRHKCKSGEWQRHMASLSGSSWNWKDEWKWTVTTGILLHTQLLCNQQFLPDKAPSEGIMETPMIWPLAPTGSCNHQMAVSQQHSHCL